MPKRFTFPGPPPVEALKYFRAKGLKPSWSYKEVWAEEHAVAFTVAKSAGFDILGDVRAAVDKAMASGQTFEQFKKELRPVLQAKGWWGRKEATDPLTGEVREVQLGSPRRLRTIYDANLRTARAAGQWERVQRTKRALPYLLYELGPSREHRPDHVQWHGLLLPVDDPWWGSHMPPNGWGCKCRVRQVSRPEAARLEKDGAPWQAQETDPETGLPTGRLLDRRMPVRTEAPPIVRREWINKRTGEVLQVPVGIDPGWDYNPGVAGRMAQALDLAAGKIEAADIGAPAVRSLVDSPAFRAWLSAPKGSYPVGLLPDGDAALIGAPRGGVVRFSAATATKQLREHPELAAGEYAWVQDALERGRRVQDTSRTLIYILEAERYVTVVKATSSGRAFFLTSFRRMPSDEAKRDEVVRRLLRKGERFEG